MQNFRELIVFRKSYALVLNLYRLSKSFPDDERFGMTSQVRRAAHSIPANIAKGCGRGQSGDFVRFLHIAAGSASELELHLELARDLQYLHANDYKVTNEAIVEIKRMLHSLIEKIEAGRDKGRGASA